VSARTSAGIDAPVIPGHEYQRELNRGGHSIVLLYRQLKPARDVAVKVILTDTVGPIAEADTMARLSNHANIVSIFSTGSDGPRPYIVMAYCPGDDLWTLVRQGPFEVRKVVRIGVQVAEAVLAAHRLSIVHHDIKPANILTDEFRLPRLTDFGIAEMLAGNPAAGQVAVSLPWAPPEVLRGDPGGPAADVYSLGATLWNLLTGRSPFEQAGNNTAAAMEARILNTQAPPTGRPDVPPDLERLLARMLAPSPAARPASAEEVVRRLEQIETALGGPVRADSPWHRDPAAARKPKPATPVTPAQAPPEPAEEEVLTRTFIRKPGARGRLEPLPEAFPDQTRLKHRPGPSSTVDEDPVRPPAPAPRRRRWIAAAAVTLAAAAVAAVLLNQQHGEDEARPGASTADRPADQDAGAGGDAVPPGVPTVTATRSDAAHLHFAWTYSAQFASDTFAWRTADGRTGTAAKPELDLEAAAGPEICLQVKVIRADGGNGTVDWSPAGCAR
jgi:serine/threonine protein kinase